MGDFKTNVYIVRAGDVRPRNQCVYCTRFMGVDTRSLLVLGVHILGVLQQCQTLAKSIEKIE